MMIFAVGGPWDRYELEIFSKGAADAIVAGNPVDLPSRAPSEDWDNCIRHAYRYTGRTRGGLRVYEAAGCKWKDPTS